MLSICSEEVDVSCLLQRQRTKMLPVNTADYTRIVVRRRCLFKDALHYFKTGIDYEKYIRVSFIGEPAVDEGGPLREFLQLLIGEIATNNALFCGSEECRVPVPNMTELGKGTYKYVGAMLAVSLIYGGPAPAFFAPSTAQYMIRGDLDHIKASACEVPDYDILQKLQKVILSYV